MPAVYFLSLSVRNVRCFGPAMQTLDLSDGKGHPSRWTILLGDNGTGKTTILQSLAGYTLVTRELFQSESKQITITGPRLAEPSLIRRLAFIREGSQDCARIEGKTAVGTSLHNAVEQVTHIVELRPDMSNSWPVPPKKGIIPVVCYGYGASRGLGSTELLEGESDGDAVTTLFSDDAELSNAEEWLLRTEYSALKESPIQHRQQKRLEQVKQVLQRVLPEVSAVRLTEPSEDQPTPRAEFQTPFGWVPLHSLGHGYRTMIAWVVDFTRRMMERYPDSPNPLAEPAVVLVDEIDLHLHPKWQRELIGHLTGLFPNTQFIVTAHSPLIVQAAGDRHAEVNLAVLRREGDQVVIDNDVDAIRGWRVDQILTSDLFDLPTARPAGFDEKLARRTRLLSQPTLSDADKAEVARLEVEIGDLPTGETADEARRMLKLMEETRELLRKYEGGNGS